MTSDIVLPDPYASASPVQIRTNRRLTKRFIDQSPVTLFLIPRVKEKKPAGGYVWVEQAPRPPQVMTIIEQTGLSGQPRPQVTIDGVDRELEFELLAEWDASIQQGDTFTHQGRDWEVVGLYYDNGYERRAMVSARG